MSHSPMPVRTVSRKRGRKLAGESRAPEIRARLTEWKQTPESFRSSLRALAADMGTSHQLLSFYLQRLEEWLGNEHAKQYQHQVNDIHARARAERRPLTGEERAQIHFYEGAIFHSILDPAMRNQVTKRVPR
jgi:hypothetical protein